MYKNDADYKSSLLAVNAQMRDIFSRSAVVNAIWTPDECENPLNNYNSILSDFKSKCTVSTTLDGGKNKINLLSVENASFISSADDVDRLYSDGIRVITLTWNKQNALASGCKAKGGITPLGKQVIDRMNKLAIALDVSHLNRESAVMGTELSNYPIATHTASNTVALNERNITDDAAKMLLKKGGIIGLCIYPVFLGGNDVFADFTKHLEHFLSLGYEKQICLGTDFDGAVMDKRLNRADKLLRLYEYLLDNKIKEETADGIFYWNAYNYFSKLLAKNK